MGKVSESDRQICSELVDTLKNKGITDEKRLLSIFNRCWRMIYKKPVKTE